MFHSHDLQKNKNKSGTAQTNQRKRKRKEKSNNNNKKKERKRKQNCNLKRKRSLFCYRLNYRILSSTSTTLPIHCFVRNLFPINGLHYSSGLFFCSSILLFFCSSVLLFFRTLPCLLCFCSVA